MSYQSLDLAIITGAGRGIGCAVAKSLASQGIEILCISQSNHCHNTAKEIISHEGRAQALQLDLGDYRNTQKQIEQFLSQHSYERIGIVGAAGILGPQGALEQSDLGEWERTFRVNILGNLAVLQATLPHMRQKKFGRVVMFAGGGSAYAYPMFPAYAASKTALVRAVENIGVDTKDLTDFSIVILSPGAVETDMLATVRQSGGEVRTVTDIAEPVGFVSSFLQSAKAPRLSGRFIHVRDEWRDVLQGTKPLPDDHWTLRRVE